MLVPRNVHLIPSIRSNASFDHLLNDLFAGSCGANSSSQRSGASVPAVNSWEEEKSYHVEAELPGLSEKDLEISVIGNEIRISGGVDGESSDESRKYHRRERRSGKFSRVLSYPVDIDSSKVSASFKNGVLEITLPKAEAALPRRIEVKS